MDKRFFLALVLTAIVIVTTPLLFPGASRRPATSVVPDTTSRSAAAPRDSAAVQGTPAAAPAAQPPGAPTGAQPTPSAASSPMVPVETTTVHAGRVTLGLTSRGAAPLSVVLDSYPSRRPPHRVAPAELVAPRQLLTRYRLALGRDTIALDTVSLRVEQTGAPAPAVVYTGDVAGHPLRLAYDFAKDTSESYLIHVTAQVAGAPAGSALLIDLPRTLLSNEPDTTDDMSHLAVSYRPTKGEVSSVAFRKLDSGEVRIVDHGPFNWVATRNKYFLVAYRAAKTPFSALRLEAVPKRGKIAAEAIATAALPLGADGSAAFDLYTGPQQFERLQKLGGDFDQVNPYGGWLQGAVQPFATIVMKGLLWMKRTTHLNYGWVLVLFGVLIRLALWPLNQGAMRTSMKMQRLQPELTGLQKKYADDPKKQQEAIMKVYKDHGMSPLSPVMGCLPMLLPMPILFALYFVFQNTIEFRGVSFLWLPDISQRDPYFITPLLMGVSMFVMSWIGMRNAPPNPQAKMMLFMMPVMMTVLFLNFASGLNMYYAVQNIAAIPQQWLLSRERAKAAATPVISGAAAARPRRT